ncbi:MAG: hypothetical protein HY335_08290 [Deinococcus sp.]|nr:hypothetical protein [Deinococcus sp.]
MPRIEPETLDRDLELARSLLQALAPQETSFDPEFRQQLWRELQAAPAPVRRWWQLPVLAPLALSLVLLVSTGLLGWRLGVVGRELALVRSQLQAAQGELTLARNLRWSAPELDFIQPAANRPQSSAWLLAQADTNQLSLAALLQLIRQSRPTILPNGQGGFEGHYDLGSGAVLSIPVTPDPEGSLSVRWSLGDGIFLSVPLDSGQ